MALARVKTWVSEVLTASDLNSEFNNILNNALSLISPLTGNLDFGAFRGIGLALGTVGSPSLQFTGDTNTGVYSSAADTIETVTGGAARQQWTNTTSTLTQGVATTGSPAALTVTAGAHTTLTASVEATDINLNLARTVQFATGAITTQRAVRVQAPTYAFVGASTITNAATLEISGAPAAGANATITNPYALWSAAGINRFDGHIFPSTTGSTAPSGGTRYFGTVSGTNAIFRYNVETGATQAWSENNTINMQLASGILALGTTVTTSAAAGDQVYANLRGPRGVNAAASDTIQMAFIDASNRLQIGIGAADIVWGKALVALGGGVAPTLGTIGGSGPTAAGQDSWMRVISTTGAAFWVPAWK